MKNQNNEGYFRRGIQTFMKSDYIGIKEVGKYDAAFIGIPTDSGVSYRKGAALAPKYIREFSYWDSVNEDRYYDLDEEVYVKSNCLKIADLGDIHITDTNPKKSNKVIQETVKMIREKTFPIIMGGDHSISYSTIRGCKDALKGLKDENFAVVHLDAHLDLEENYLDMPNVFHGNPFKKLIDENVIPARNHYSIGQRGIVPAYMIDYVNEKEINLYSHKRIAKMGFDKFLNELFKKLQQYEAIFITLDVDCINPAELKGTGTPVEGGFNVSQILKFVRGLKNLPIVAFEVVELAPELDESGYSSIVVANILWNFLSFGGII